jgi:hypothetical protein
VDYQATAIRLHSQESCVCMSDCSGRACMQP